MTSTVLHKPDQRMFTLDYDGHDTAFLEYQHISDDPLTVDMFETFVPPTLRGQGIAKLLADAAFNWAVANNVQLKLSCWYLEGYLQRHPRPDVTKLLLKN